jgi:hypothetical protein
MLKFELSALLLANSVTRYLDDTLSGTRTAKRVEMVRKIWGHHVRGFNELQPINLTSCVRDGKVATIVDGILQPLEQGDPPKLTGALLRGIKFDRLIRLPDSPCRRHGPTYRSLDPESYVTQIALSRYHDITCLVAYLHLVRTMHLVWIGRLSDVTEGFAAISATTRGWCDWTTIDADYQRRLSLACSEKGT